ncbi:MAG: hypothetical protein JWN04_1109 [Myxococcaceae bacterium]|nr:hypothetical protein [Myxococcaceae bacterium]
MIFRADRALTRPPRAVGARRALAWLCLAALACGGCAGVPRRQRITRTIAVVGGLVAAAGGAMTAGCVSDGMPGACSAGPKDGTVAIGLPIMAVGAAIIVGALLARPKSQRPAGPPVVRHGAASVGDPFGALPNQGY